MLVFLFGVITTLFWVSLSFYLWHNRRRVRFLASVRETGPENEPPVVVIIAVRNEEEKLAEALQSVCHLNYTRYRLLLINDRSTDGTAAIMSRFANQYPHISIMHIKELPPGWLGKNHALYQGYKASSEEWMLFTDADVLFSAGTLKKALHYVLAEKLDHLTVLPYVRSRSELLNSVLSTFITMLEVRQRPWAVRNPKSKASLGVGAFNLVRRNAYEKAGTHQAIALRPDDDLKLGRQIKASGCRSDVVYGKSLVELEWYSSLQEFVKGLMKNTFSVFNYRVLPVVLTGVLPTLFFFVLPLPFLLSFGKQTERLLALIILLYQVALYGSYRGSHSRWWHALMIPFAGLLMAYILLRSCILTLRQKGIYWRNSFYPLSELRKNA